MRYFIFDSREIYELRIFFTSMWVKYKQGYVFKSNDPMHIPPGITFQHSFFLKTKILILRFFSVLHLWPGSLRVCIFNLDAFLCNLALFLALLLFGKILHWSLAFVLCCFIFFCTRNGQIGCAVFVIAKITAFWAMFLDVSCAMFCCFI